MCIYSSGQTQTDHKDSIIIQEDSFVQQSIIFLLSFSVRLTFYVYFSLSSSCFYLKTYVMMLKDAPSPSPPLSHSPLHTHLVMVP